MAKYFIDPYKMYHEKLKTAQSIVSAAASIKDNSSLVVSTISRLQSQIETAIWEELGYRQLVTTSIPALKSRASKLDSNMQALSQAANLTINDLLPILIEFKETDELYETTEKEYSNLKEPSPMYQSRYDSKTGKSVQTNTKTDEYIQYENKKAELETKLKELELAIETLKNSADSKVLEIKALNGQVEDFTTDTSGAIVEIEGLTLTEDEQAFIEALEKSIAEYSEAAGVDYDTQLSTLSGLYGNGKTVLYNNGGKEYGYSRQILTSHGKLVTVFQQAWNEKIKFVDRNSNLSRSGCGYNALASILSSKYSNITPESLFNAMGRKFLYASSIKSYCENVLGIKVGSREEVPRSNYQAYKEHLVTEVQKGNMVMATVNARKDNKYTDSSHWVAIVDYDPSTDSFYVTDSADPEGANAGPISVDTFLKNYSVNTNVIYIADSSGYIA